MVTFIRFPYIVVTVIVITLIIIVFVRESVLILCHVIWWKDPELLDSDWGLLSLFYESLRLLI